MISNIAVAIDLETDGGRLLEVGLTTIDWRKGLIMQTLSLPIHPGDEPEVSDHVRDLTGWDNARLRKGGVSKYEVARRMTDLYGMRSRLIVCDASDEVSFVETALNTKLSEHRINVAILFALRHRIEMSASLEQMLVATRGDDGPLNFEGQPHRASDDSRNIARLFLALM